MGIQPPYHLGPGVVFGEWIVLYLDDIAIELGMYGSRTLALGEIGQDPLDTTTTYTTGSSIGLVTCQSIMGSLALVTNCFILFREVYLVN